MDTDQFRRPTVAALSDAARTLTAASERTGDAYMRPDRAEVLEQITAALHQVEAARDHWVAHQRFLGDSWTDIAAALGVTRQAARKRWRENPGDAEVERINTPAGGGS